VPKLGELACTITNFTGKERKKGILIFIFERD
jgi:hypothetical protein